MSGSPLRSLMADASGKKYYATDNLEEAMGKKDYYMVMEGDDGGQIYLTCPVRLIKCKNDVLKKILKIIDVNQWPGNPSNMRRIIYEYSKDRMICGGMGGGLTLKSDLWIHQKIQSTKNILREIITSSSDSGEKLLELEEILKKASELNN